MKRCGSFGRVFAITVVYCLVVFLSSVTPAKAMCVYSHIDRLLEVNLDWRWGFDPRWTIHSGDHRCTQGQGGQVSIRVRNHEDYVVSSGDDVVFDVDDHGWVSVSVIKRGSNGHPSEWKFENKDKHGHVKKTETRRFESPWGSTERQTEPAMQSDTYDLAEYWMVTPGQWVILRDDSGESSTRMIVVRDGDDLNLEFRSILSDWSESVDRRLDETLTDNDILLKGEYNFRDGNSVWIPLVSLPRQVQVGQVFQYTSQEQFLEELYPQYFTMVIDNDRYSVTTDAGTFDDCLKIVINEIDHNSIITDVYFLARGIGVVRYISTGSYEDGPTNVPFNSTWNMAQFGTE